MFFTNGRGCHTCHLFAISFSTNFHWKTCGPSELQVIIVMPPAYVKKVATFVQNPQKPISKGPRVGRYNLKFTIHLYSLALPGFRKSFPSHFSALSSQRYCISFLARIMPTIRGLGSLQNVFDMYQSKCRMERVKYHKYNSIKYNMTQYDIIWYNVI